MGNSAYRKDILESVQTSKLDSRRNSILGESIHGIISGLFLEVPLNGSVPMQGPFKPFPFREFEFVELTSENLGSFRRVEFDEVGEEGGKAGDEGRGDRGEVDWCEV